MIFKPGPPSNLRGGATVDRTLFYAVCSCQNRRIERALHQSGRRTPGGVGSLTLLQRLLGCLEGTVGVTGRQQRGTARSQKIGADADIVHDPYGAECRE